MGPLEAKQNESRYTEKGVRNSHHAKRARQITFEKFPEITKYGGKTPKYKRTADPETHPGEKTLWMHAMSTMHADCDDDDAFDGADDGM